MLLNPFGLLGKKFLQTFRSQKKPIEQEVQRNSKAKNYSPKEAQKLILENWIRDFHSYRSDSQAEGKVPSGNFWSNDLSNIVLDHLAPGTFIDIFQEMADGDITKKKFLEFIIHIFSLVEDFAEKTKKESNKDITLEEIRKFIISIINNDFNYMANNEIHLLDEHPYALRWLDRFLTRIGNRVYSPHISKKNSDRLVPSPDTLVLNRNHFKFSIEFYKDSGIEFSLLQSTERGFDCIYELNFYSSEILFTADYVKLDIKEHGDHIKFSDGKETEEKPIKYCLDKLKYNIQKELKKHSSIS